MFQRLSAIAISNLSDCGSKCLLLISYLPVAISNFWRKYEVMELLMYWTCQVAEEAEVCQMRVVNSVSVRPTARDKRTAT